MFESKYGEFAEDRIAKLGRREDLGQLNFDEVVPKVTQIRELMELIDRNLDWVDDAASSEAGPAIDRTSLPCKGLRASIHGTQPAGTLCFERSLNPWGL